MWFGTLLDGDLYVIYANANGRISVCPASEITADVRYVADLSKVAGSGRTGAGWVDLEDLTPKPDAVVDLGDHMTPQKLEEIGGPEELAQKAAKALIEGKDYITDREGHKYDVNTLREIPD
jgi:hypothetical protein